MVVISADAELEISILTKIIDRHDKDQVAPRDGGINFKRCVDNSFHSWGSFNDATTPAFQE